MSKRAAARRHAPSMPDRLLESRPAYATLGTTSRHVPEERQLVGPFQAVIGFVLIGWSTVYLATTMEKLKAGDVIMEVRPTA